MGTNFFIDESQLHQNRAKATMELLKELNEEVNILYTDEDPASLIRNNINYFLKFDLVITSNLDPESVLILSKFLWSQKIALLVVKTYGFIGSLRFAIPEHDGLLFI